jgi:hypothetical protein
MAPFRTRVTDAEVDHERRRARRHYDAAWRDSAYGKRLDFGSPFEVRWFLLTQRRVCHHLPPGSDRSTATMNLFYGTP